MNSCIWILLLLFCCKGSNSASNDKCWKDVHCDRGCDNNRRCEERREDRWEERHEERCHCERDVCDDNDRRGASWRDYPNYGRSDAYDRDHNDTCCCENN